jgi:hypothetical protein
VDYNLMSTLPGLHVLGEANFSDHGANRLGASALMQGLADGYFVIPYTIGHYLASNKLEKIGPDHHEAKRTRDEVETRIGRLLSIGGKRTTASFHRELGKIMWDDCGMARNEAGLNRALAQIPALRDEFWKNVNVTGDGGELNPSLEHAGRVADFLELGELICLDALEIAAGASNGLALARLAAPAAPLEVQRTALEDFLRTLVQYGPRLGRSELTAEALVGAARVLVRSDAAPDRDRARHLAERCLDEHPATSWAQAASELLANSVAERK